ncbi:hypothetical protein C8R44DRAFT_981287, partial [Mycena epipterygia]
PPQRPYIRHSWSHRPARGPPHPRLPRTLASASSTPPRYSVPSRPPNRSS